MAALDIRDLRALDAFKPTVIVTNPTGDPSASSKSVVLPYAVLPSLHDPAFIQKMKDRALANLSTSTSEKSTASSSKPTSFADALRSDAQKGQSLVGADNRTFTTNGAGAFSRTQSPTLDAFYGLGAWSSGKEVYARLYSAWEEDPETTLKLIYNFRSIHEGKNSKDMFYHAFGWLWKNHPTTALASLETLVAQVCDDPRNVKEKKKFEEESLNRERHNKEFIERPARSHGYWKDLLNIVSLAYHGYLGNPKTDFEVLKEVFGPEPKFAAEHKDCDHPLLSDNGALSTVEVGVLHEAEWIEKAKIRRREAHAKMVQELATKLDKDEKFRDLYVTVARLFADALLQDVSTLVKVSQVTTTNGDERAVARERRKLDFSLTLAAKWAPTAQRTFDRQFLMTSAIAEILFPYNGPPDSAARSAQAHTSRGLLRRYVLTPLRNYLALPETSMHAGKWELVQYNRIPALCFASNKSLFWAHDEERFVAHLEEVTKGKKTISGSSLLPHQILLSALHAGSEALPGMQRGSPSVRGRVAKQKGRMVKAKLELEMREKLGKKYAAIYDSQWTSMVSHVSALGALDNSIAICDVSGSMGSYVSAGIYFKDGAFVPTQPVQPIFPALALSIMVAQLAAPPWKNMFITFSQTPELVEIPSMADGAGLGDIAKSMSGTNWGMNTNFEAVFTRLLLPTAVRHKLPRDQMVKRVFVFSDMQFDAARSYTPSDGSWPTIHKAIKQQYKRAGYDVPELVYWNLAGGRYDEGMGMAAPVDANEEGVSLMSGFSGSMLKAFVVEEVEEDEANEETKEWDDADVELPEKEEKRGKKTDKPEDKMRRILEGKSYAGLKVYD